VANGVEPQSGGESGLRVIKVLEAASRSLGNGGGGELVLDEQLLVDEQAQV